MTNRREMLTTAGFGLGVATLGGGFFGLFGKASAGPTAKFPLELSKDEWKKRLTPAQYYILREEGTERAYTSPLNDEHRKGVFSCAGCNQKAFMSDTKFDSGTGWPSFYQPIKGAVGENSDRTLGMLRTEIHCSNCGGHLGHVFDDGPKPTGLRYCMNGAGMKFEAGASA